MYAMEKGSANRTFGEAAPAQPTDAVGSSGTGTNVQEADVDESDVAKTDGRLVVQVSGDRLVVTDVSGNAPTTAVGHPPARPGLGAARSCCCTATTSSWWARRPAVATAARSTGDGPTRRTRRQQRRRRHRLRTPGPVTPTRTRVIGIDIADPAFPRITSDRSVDGGSVSAREYPDGTVRRRRHHRLPAARLRAAQPRPESRRGDPAQPARSSAGSDRRVAARHPRGPRREAAAARLLRRAAPASSGPGPARSAC